MCAWRSPSQRTWTSVYASATRTEAELSTVAGWLAGTGVHAHDLVSTPTGLRQLFVKDPDGNMLEFIGPTKAPRVRRME